MVQQLSVLISGAPLLLARLLWLSWNMRHIGSVGINWFIVYGTAHVINVPVFFPLLLQQMLWNAGLGMRLCLQLRPGNETVCLVEPGNDAVSI